MSVRSACHALTAGLAAFVATLALQPAVARASEGVEIRFASAASTAPASRRATERRQSHPRALCGPHHRFEVRSAVS